MADIDVTPGTGKTVSTESISSKEYQNINAGWGPAGTFNKPDIASGKPFPVQLRNSAGQLLSDTTGLLISTSQLGTLSTTAVAMATPGYSPVALVTDQVWATAAHSGTMTFTPGAASNAAGFCVGAAASITSMGLASGRVQITSASILIPHTTAVATTWRLYLYNVTPPSAIATGNVWDLPSGDQASFLGYCDIGTTSTDQGSSQYAEVNGINKQIKLAATPTIFAYLVNLTTATLAAVAHTVTLHTVEV